VAEPEEVIIEAARVATATARALWLRAAAPDVRPRLSDLRSRLGLFVAMLFPDPLEIATAEPPAPRSLLARFALATPPHAQPAEALASTDGTRVRLPPELKDLAADAVLPAYRLLAVEQAARACRGTPAWVPTGDALIRDLFLLAEAAAIDRLVVWVAPRLTGQIASARAVARARRPRARLTPQETEVERLTCVLLGAAPAKPPSAIPAQETPAESLRWAQREALRIRALSGRYRGVAPVPLWGAPPAPPDALPTAASDARQLDTPRAPRVHQMRRRPRVRAPGEEDDGVGMWLPRADDPQESVEDPMGLQRPGDRADEAEPGDLGDSLSELPEARLMRTPEPPREVLVSEEPAPRIPAPPPPECGAAALVYPEWDWQAARYQVRGAIVRERSVPGEGSSWTNQALRRHAALIRLVRRDFERLRPRRQVLPHQTDGADVDIDAYVVSAADRMAGGAPDGRLYLDARRVRRDAAVLLLVDVSASTDGWIGGGRRIIDVEKEALLIVAEALGALGEQYAIFGFRGEGPERVDLLSVKRFDEATGEQVTGRIAGLEPDGYTRLGAAARHATALLSREAAKHRLLLLLSDGRPNDVDRYEGRYGLEDTRQALAEARLQGISPFCVTIDREAPRYASRVFGDRDHAVLRHPERLPEVLVAVLRRMLRS
jgi:nitric oxide reductase NorD protein